MPGPVPKNVTSFTLSPLEVARREPQCMALVAAVATAWTEIEQALAFLIGNALGSADSPHLDVVRTSPNMVARLAIETAETIRTKIKFANAVVRPLLQSSMLLDQWKDLEAPLYDRAKERSEIVHAQWAVSDQLAGEIVRMRPNGNERWRIRDFEEVIARFNRLRDAILDLSHAIGAAKVAGAIHNRQ